MSAPFKIQLAYEQNDMVYLIDSKNVSRNSISLNGGKLLGFTESTVIIKRGNTIYTHDSWDRVTTNILGVNEVNHIVLFIS